MTSQDLFLEKYGRYNEVLYLLSNGDITKHEEIFKMSAHHCIYWAEYLIMKRIVENESLNSDIRF